MVGRGQTKEISYMTLLTEQGYLFLSELSSIRLHFMSSSRLGRARSPLVTASTPLHATPRIGV